MIVIGMAEPTEETTTEPGTLPYVAGVTRGGDAYVNVPILPAPGVNGLMPILSISYGGGRERQRVNESLPGDVLGYGWQVGGLSAIRRCVKNQPSTATVDLTNTSHSLCLDGEPLVLVSGIHLNDGAEYRTLRESFVKITLKIEERFDDGTPDITSSWFEVQTPDGMKLEYGRTEDSRLRYISELTVQGVAYSYPSLPYLWSVNRETDAYGNTMDYEYYEDELAAVRHPKRISYGNGGDAEITFEYAGRTDLAAVEFDDFMQEQHLLLHGVRVRLDGNDVRHYRLISETAPTTNWRRLNLVQLCAYNETGSGVTCIKPLDVDWGEPSGSMPMVKTRVVKLTGPLGSETRFEYGALTETGSDDWILTNDPYAAVDTVTDTEALPMTSGTIKEVVTKVRRSNGLGGWRDTSYAYKGGGRRSTKNWGLLGFDAIRETDSATGVVTYRRYRMDFPHLGEEAEVRQYDGDYGTTGTGVDTLAVVALTHAEKTLTYDNNATTKLPYVENQTSFHYEDGTLLGATRTGRTLSVATRPAEQVVTAMTEVTETASNATLSSGGPSWPSSPTVQRKTEVSTTFDNQTGTGDWLIGFGSRVERKDYGRDSGSLGLDRTRLTTFTREDDTNRVDTAMRLDGDTRLELTTDLDYDSTGNLISSEVSGCATCNVATRSESASGFIDGRYPGTLTNAVSHQQTVRYDARYGLADWVTDANGRLTQAVYDNFGRETSLTTPDSVNMTTERGWCSDSGVSCPATVWGVSPVYREKVSSPVSPTRQRYFDKLGRMIREEVQSFGSASTWDRVDRRYNAQGLVRRVSEPYSATGSDNSSAPPSPSACGDVTVQPLHRCVTHDNLGRATAEVRADGGSVTWSYDPISSTSRVRVTRSETVKAADGTTTTTTRYTVRDYNLTGELVKLVEGDSDSNPTTLAADGVATDYAWDGSGLLKSVTVNGTYTTGFDYDAAGNRTAVSNPNFSTVMLRYTALGELWQRDDSKGMTTWSYDKLGRLIKRKGPDGVSEWDWDTTNGRGSLEKRCRHDSAGTTSCLTLAAPHFQESYTYGTDARLDSAETTVRAGGLLKSYTRSYTHDTNGRLLTQSYPSGLTVKREYNAQGYLEKLKNKADMSDLVTYKGVNARGQTTTESYGNGTQTVRAFDPKSGRLKDIDTTLGMTTEILDDTYKWRSDGLLQSRADGTGTTLRRETFVHDRLGRLKSSATPLSGGGSRTLSMTYDKLGNLKTRSSSVTGDLDVSVTALGSGTSAPGPTAATTITVGTATHALSYDTGGRVKRDDDQSMGGVDRYFDWNARGLLKLVVFGDSLTDTTPEAAEEYAYGPDGARYYRKSTWKDDSDPDNVTYPVEHRFYMGGFEERVGSGEDPPRVETTRIGGAILHTRSTTTMEDPQDSENTITTQTSTMRYLHRDHLGSVRAVTDASGTAVSTASFDPYGGRRLDDGTRESSETERQAAADNATLDSARGFTGHEQLDRTGLIHMGGRVYDPRLGRFLSPDPVIGNPGSSQSWNLYSYVGNSPLSFTDPTGLIRQPFPWENDPCSAMRGCFHFNGAGGHGPTSQRVDSLNTYIAVGVATFFFPSWSSGWGVEGGGGFGYNVVSVVYFFFGAWPTSSTVSVPGDQQPGDRPVNAGRDVLIDDGNGAADHTAVTHEREIINEEQRSEVDYTGCGGGNECVVTNQGVRNELDRLNELLIARGQGYVIVTGGDSRYDEEANQSISTSTGEPVGGRQRGSYHNDAQGNRAVDIRGRAINMPREELEQFIERNTNFGVLDRRYPDGHIHLTCNSPECVDD